MAAVTRALVAVRFIRKTHLSLSEVRRRFYKNWSKSKEKTFTGYAKQCESEEGKNNIQTQIKKMKGLKRKKAAHMMEIKTDSGTINQKANFAYSFFEKLIPIGVVGVTNGKGYEGVATRRDENPMGGFAHYEDAPFPQRNSPDL
ncbi:hypothetical protein Bca4012_020550 [Brassica carinata]